MALTLHLVRHGEVDNPDRLCYGRLPGFPLSSRGVQQVNAAAAYLAGIGPGALLLTSPLKRAWDTAAILSEALATAPPIVDERLVEAGSWRDGLPRSFAPLAYGRRLLSFGEREQNEPSHAVIDRMLSALGEAARSGEVERPRILVSHQTPLTLARTALERQYRGSARQTFGRKSPWLYARAPCDLASVTTLVLEPEGDHLRLLSLRYFTPTAA